MSTAVRSAVGEGAAGLRGAARGGALNLVAAGFSAAAGLVVTTLVARGLGSGAAGVFFSATSAFLLVQMLAKLGADTGLVYWLARLRAVRRHDLLHRCLRIGLVPVLTAAVLAGAALSVTAPWLSHLSLPAHHDGRIPHVGQFVRQLRTLALFLPLAALSDTLLSATRGYRTMRPTALVEKVARPALQLVLLLVAVLLSAGTTVFTLAWVGPYLVSVLLAAYLLSKVDRNTLPVPVPADRDDTTVSVPDRLSTAFWRFTAPRALSSIAQIAMQRLDILLVAGLLGFPSAALYTVATRFVVVGQLGNQAIGTAVQPRLAELLPRGELTAGRVLYQGSTAWIVLLTWPMYLLVAVFAPLYLTVFGHGYTAGAAGIVVAVLCLSMLVAMSCGMVDMVLSMGGRTTWNLANVLLALGVNVVLDLILIPSLGILGAAVGWAVAIIVKSLVPLGQIALVLKLHPFGRGTLCAVLLATCCVGLPAGLARLALGTGPVALVSALLIAVPCYLTGCYLLRHRLKLAEFLRHRRTTA